MFLLDISSIWDSICSWGDFFFSDVEGSMVSVHFGFD